MVSRPGVVQPRLRRRLCLHDDEPRAAPASSTSTRSTSSRARCRRSARRSRRATTRCGWSPRPTGSSSTWSTRATRPCRSSRCRAMARWSRRTPTSSRRHEPTALAIDPQGKFLYVTFTYQTGFSASTRARRRAIFPVNADNSLGTRRRSRWATTRSGIDGELLQPLCLCAGPGAVAQRARSWASRRTPRPAR